MNEIDIIMIIIAGIIIFFQDISISLSYRIRGNDTRNQIIDIIIIMVKSGILACDGLIIIMVEIILIIIIALYSAIKIKEKNPLEYSVLYPDTSSDSDSLKSNGVRLVSASIVVIQQIKINGIISKNGVFALIDASSVSININIITGGKRIRIITISYEIVCAKER